MSESSDADMISSSLEFLKEGKMSKVCHHVIKMEFYLIINDNRVKASILSMSDFV